VTRWTEIHGAIEKVRDERKADWRNALIVQVKRAASAKVCSNMDPHRVKRAGRTIELAPCNDSVMKTVKAEVPAIALLNLPALDDAKLTFRVVLQADEKRIEQYTVSAVGKGKVTGRPWYVRVDLDDEQKGNGPCGHPMLHCHVGVDSSVKDGQESRVPLPWLGPDEAVAWILATLDPRLEPR
jgi:hypothetical protein